MTEAIKWPDGAWLPAPRSGHPASADLLARRSRGRLPGGYAPVRDVDVAERSIGGVPCVVATPASFDANLVHVHGGGFRIGSPQRIAPFASHLAHRAGARVVLPGYRLAPEHPFPGALHDIVAVCRALVEQGGGKWILSGDSAGGNLAAVVAQHSPAGSFGALALISPWLDLSNSAESFLFNARSDGLFSHASASEAAALYLQSMTTADARVSPLHGPVDDFPPTLLLVGCGEVLLNDSLAFAARLARAGRDVELHAIPGMPHVAVTFSPDGVGSARGMDILSAFVRKWSRHEPR